MERLSNFYRLDEMLMVSYYVQDVWYEKSRMMGVKKSLISRMGMMRHVIAVVRIAASAAAIISL